MSQLDDPRSFHSCDLCPYGSKSLFRIVSHIRKHNARFTPPLFSCASAPETYECECCGFETDLLVNQCDHNNVAHKASEIRYDMRQILMRHSCANCHFHTHSLLVLLRHVCNCDKRNSFKNVKPHVAQPEARGDLVRCQFCSDLIRHKNNLKRHILDRHTAPGEIKWFECAHCAYRAKRKSHLDKHVLSKHTKPDEGQWLECEHCGLKTRHKNTLRSHVKAKHAKPKEIRWFSCAMCAFKTKYKFNLKEHVTGRHRPTNKRYRPFKREKLASF